MGGIHIADALEIPYFRAFTMTWTKTRAYPHAFAVPERKVRASEFFGQAAALNVISHVTDGRKLQLSRKESMRFYVNWLDYTHTAAVVRTLRPDLLERHLRSGQQMATFCFGPLKHKLGQDGSQQGPVLVQFQSHPRPNPS